MRKCLEISVIFLILAVTVFILSDNVIWITDCITYRYNFATGDKIRNVMDIFGSQYAHYFLWNGRYVAHWLCQFFICFFGKGVFAAVNAVFYIALVLLVLRNSTSRQMTTRSVLTATCLVLFFCDTDYGPTCQIGYIWMSVFVLIFLHLFFNFAKDPSMSVPIYIGLLIFSLIAGNAQEAINIGVGGAMAIFLLTHLRRLSVAQWCMIIGFGIGALLLCLSPATINRTDEMVTAPIYSVANFIISLRVAYIFLVILIYKCARGSISLRSFYKDNAFFINAIIVLMVFNFIIGIGGTRQLFGIELFSAILVLKLLNNQSFSKPVLWIFSLALVGIYILKYIDIRKMDNTHRELLTKISDNPAGPLYIDFPGLNPYIHPTPFYRYGVYLDYALMSTACEVTGSYENNTIQCYPEKAEEFFKEQVASRAYEYLPGEFMLMQSKITPEKFTLHRSIGLFGIRVPLPPYTVEFDSDSYLNTPDYNILYLPGIMPMIKNEYVTID